MSAELPWELFLYQSRASKVPQPNRIHNDAVSSGNNWSSAPSPGFQNGFKYLIAKFSVGFTIVSHKWKAKRLRFYGSSLVPFQFCSCRSFLHGQSVPPKIPALSDPATHRWSSVRCHHPHNHSAECNVLQHLHRPFMLPCTRALLFRMILKECLKYVKYSNLVKCWLKPLRQKMSIGFSMARWRVLMPGAPTAAMGRPRMSHRSLNSSTSRGSPSKETAISRSRPGLLCDGKYLDSQIKSENFGILNLFFCKTSVKLSQFQVESIFFTHTVESSMLKEGEVFTSAHNQTWPTNQSWQPLKCKLFANFIMLHPCTGQVDLILWEPHDGPGSPPVGPSAL